MDLTVVVNQVVVVGVSAFSFSRLECGRLCWCIFGR